MNRLYKYKKEIDQTVIADIMMNQLYYYLRTRLIYEVIQNGYVRFILYFTIDNITILLACILKF